MVLRRFRTRRRTPTILQMEAVECGAACLDMVLGYYGKHVPLEELRVACGVSRDGSKASNIVRAARRYGLIAAGIRAEPAALETTETPAILHWNFNHFVVLEGVQKRKVYLNDPAYGPRQIDREELDQAFTGVVLTFKPGPDLERGGRRGGVLRSLGARVGGLRLEMAFVLLVALLLVVPGLATPAFSKIFVDEILVGGAAEWTRPLLLAMLIAALTVAGLTLIQREFLLRFETHLAATGSTRFFWHVLRLPLTFFSQRFGGEVGSRVWMNDRIAQILSGDLAASFIGLFAVGFYAVLMMHYDPYLALIGVGTAGLNLAFLCWIGRERRDANQRLLQERGKLMGAAMGGLQTIETLKATGSESDFFGRWAGHHAKMLNAQQYLGVRTQLLNVVPPALAALASALVLGAGAGRVIEGDMTMGALVAFQGLLMGFLSPVGQFVSLGGTLQESYGDLRRLEDVLNAGLDKAAAISRSRGTGNGAQLRVPETPRLRGSLRVNNLTFGFSPLDPPLLTGIDLEMAPGECVAIVGGSGSGKSTLARLICGLYEPWSGEILFDGRSRMEQDPRVLSTSIGYVDQEIFLFDGTIRENIALWDETLSERAIIRAAKDACLHDMITVRPGGYRARVEEGGRNFSGGQRQRMEIARALATNPSLLVMDEATSALDSETERLVGEHIRRRGCTCVIVAHRLSAVRDADLIVVMNRGKIVQRGRHDDLVAQDGLYRSLMESH